MSTDRIQKIIARSGLASRREAEQLVLDGRVKVNGETIYQPGYPVDSEKDLIKVDDEPLPGAPEPVYLLLFKPRGYITSRRDPEGRKEVLSLVAHLKVRVETVGRLDINTTGAILLTNDGDLANKLTHPKSRVPKRYMAKVWKTPSERTLNRIRRGVHLEDGRTSPCKVRLADQTEGENAWVEITVTEGRNRLIRRLFETVNHPVSKLRRESFATISVRGMEPGQVRRLSGEELQRLRDIADGKQPSTAGHGSRYGKGHARPKAKRSGTPLSRKKGRRRSGTPGKGRR
ncbi:MAG: pseudouridine synthase [Myxococcota bacterium]|nr:pseudouridine synthase [Myxococcota bacterium]